MHSVANMSKHHRIDIWVRVISNFCSLPWLGTCLLPAGLPVPDASDSTDSKRHFKVYHAVVPKSWPVAWLVGGSGLHLHLVSLKKQQS